MATAGTIIFFDWDGDGISDHVGIVEKCENGRVYTVEGNSNDRVQQSIYSRFELDFRIWIIIDRNK